METLHQHTHTHGEFRLRFGRPLPLGVSYAPGGITFSVFSAHATRCTLVLFHAGEEGPYEEIPYPKEFQIGHVFAMTVFDLDPEGLEYGFRMDGPFAPREGHRFDRRHILLDPEARVISGRDVWKKPLRNGSPDAYPLRARILTESFEWERDRPFFTPTNELVIYEMHLRGFTRHDSSGVAFPGTFEGMREKIPYLKELGVNCVELMPIFEFDEMENTRTNPLSGETLCNYWGYSTVGFYAPKSGFAVTGGENRQVMEF